MRTPPLLKVYAPKCASDLSRTPQKTAKSSPRGSQEAPKRLPKASNEASEAVKFGSPSAVLNFSVVNLSTLSGTVGVNNV